MNFKAPIPRMMIATAVAALACVVSARPAFSDEFTLKDGSKISGTIVGYEGDMFRVQTDYGFRADSQG